ncbi:MAG: roadblock/LC7 domain-containing protein, partial [Blastocatellia bacterium]|nr:roadblock/LC7 domain-containing protein [Blastocatellia bacterium]
FHVSRAHKTLLVRAGASEGLIYYQDGEIVHAVTQDQTGEPAFRQIINWQSNDYAVFTDEPPPTRTIFRDFDSLLSAATQPGSMSTPTTAATEQQQTQQEISEVIPDAPQPLHEAPVAESQPAEQLADEPPPAVIQQETSDSCGEIPSTKPEIPNVSDFESGISDFPQRGTKMPAFSSDDKRHIEELLMASDHLEGGLLLTVDGAILASSLPPHALSSSVLADAGSLFRMCQRLAEELGRGHHRQSFIQGDLGNIILSEVGDGSFLVFITNAKATLGLALLQARQRAQKVGHIMANYA